MRKKLTIITIEGSLAVAVVVFVIAVVNKPSGDEVMGRRVV